MGQLLLIHTVMRLSASAHARGDVRFLSSAKKSFVISAMRKRHRSRPVTALMQGSNAASMTSPMGLMDGWRKKSMGLITAGRLARLELGLG